MWTWVPLRWVLPFRQKKTHFFPLFISWRAWKALTFQSLHLSNGPYWEWSEFVYSEQRFAQSSYVVEAALLHCSAKDWQVARWKRDFKSGSTISTLLHDRINPKDCQVLSLGDTGFLQFFRVVSRDYGKPRKWMKEIRCEMIFAQWASLQKRMTGTQQNDNLYICWGLPKHPGSQWGNSHHYFTKGPLLTFIESTVYLCLGRTPT